MKTHLTSSKTPVKVIESLPRRPEQPAKMRKYLGGYSHYMDSLPVLDPKDPLVLMKARISGIVVSSLAEDLRLNAPWIHNPIDEGDFERTILAVEDPVYEEGEPDEALASVVGHYAHIFVEKELAREGAELLIGHWGVGFASPVHGHAPGLLHEDILFGEIMVNTYRWIHGETVRLIRSDLVGPGNLVSKFNPPDEHGKRIGLIHNFVATKHTASLHYVAEHTRDGRDNGYNVEQFTDYMPLSGVDVSQITGDEGRQLRAGDVALVRSANVPQYRDHFIVITGAPVVKEHGLRPQDVALQASTPHVAALLDKYTPTTGGLILLKLNQNIAALFHEFHGITVEGSKVTFPEA